MCHNRIIILGILEKDKHYAESKVLHTNGIHLNISTEQFYKKRSEPEVIERS